jgi:hypothetical protein
MSDLPSFGPFRIVRRLGRGGMAETFVAERQGLAGFSQRVCLKRVLPALCADPGFVAMFQEEARLAARLVHPHIAQIYDFGADEGQWWMALELVDGVDLRTLLETVRALDQPMPLDLVVLILTDVSSALACSHGSQPVVVHRDVTPSNVLLSREGAVKLADFGIAKQTDGERATASGIKGKVPYMAPEQALGGTIDARTDLFALGVMAFELLAGRRPFDGPTELATLANLAADRRPSLASVAPHAPAALVALVEQLLAPAPDARPESAAAVLDTLSADAPPLSARRALGVLVERAQTRAETRPLDAMPAASATGTAPPPPEPAAPTQPAAPENASATAPRLHASPPPAGPEPAPARAVAPGRSRRGAWFALFSLGIAASVAIGIAATRSASPHAAESRASSSPVAPSPTALAAPSPTALVARAPRDAKAPAQTASSTAAAPPAQPVPAVASSEAAPRRGTLVVTAYPWGFVEIDGRELGRAPVRALLDEGRHRVRVRADDVVKMRRATVVAGETREVLVSLE